MVRFLSRVVKYSTENKMTANNLSICIGGSILFLKDQQQFSINQTSLSTNYTNGSLILELLINHHEDLFPMNSMERNFKIQPDLIPTEFYTVRLFHFFIYFYEIHLTKKNQKEFSFSI